MAAPLADRIRPQTLDDVVGQEHLLGRDKVLRRMVESGNIPNLIFTARPALARRLSRRSSPNVLERSSAS